LHASLDDGLQVETGAITLLVSLPPYLALLLNINDGIVVVGSGGMVGNA
jgi:hypothetical protein